MEVAGFSPFFSRRCHEVYFAVGEVCFGPTVIAWIPFVCLLIGIAGFIANATIRSIVIGQPVDDWSDWKDPQMLLPGIGTITNLALGVSFTSGSRPMPYTVE
ncbi:hypothetical protein B0T20DRAFT_243544 [Sordaria brevicollis]|uniref:Uncharacterized protein n=1 Tax=Sordaria brevicollis TaxID=83679 RepID=A0AAE0PBG3_SORBR|nr:hypothetical protein B0T20DRAFT_243544 [Sordaria brevicollis]